MLTTVCWVIMQTTLKVHWDIFVLSCMHIVQGHMPIMLHVCILVFVVTYLIVGSLYDVYTLTLLSDICTWANLHMWHICSQCHSVKWLKKSCCIFLFISISKLKMQWCCSWCHQCHIMPTFASHHQKYYVASCFNHLNLAKQAPFYAISVMWCLHWCIIWPKESWEPLLSIVLT